MEMNKRERIDEANIIRGIACLAVIMIHITSEPITILQKGSIHSMIFTLINRSLRFATPTFIFLSGLTLFYSYEKKSLNYIEFIKKRFKSTLIPYLIWSIIYFFFYYSRGIYYLSLKMFVENLVLGKMNYHLYFILIITQFYILFPLFLKAYKKLNSHVVLIVTFIVNLLFLEYGYMTYSDRFFMSYIFFFSYGCYAAKNIYYYKRIAKRLKYLFAFAYFGVAIYDSYLFYQSYIWNKPISNFVINLTWILMTVFIILFLTGFNTVIETRYKHISWFINIISESSYYIYLAHPLVLTISNYSLLKLGIYSITSKAILNMIVVYTVTLVLSIQYTKLKRERKLKFIPKKI